MPRPHYRSAYVLGRTPPAAALALLLIATLAPRSGLAQAADGDVHASMQCDRASEPGRVRCTVEARIDGGRTLAWADVEILALPDFASALKGRIGPQDALARDATSTKWALALVARRGGQGEARARVRVVACDAAPPAASGGPSPSPRCNPVVVEVKATVSVGG